MGIFGSSKFLTRYGMATAFCLLRSHQNPECAERGEMLLRCSLDAARELAVRPFVGLWPQSLGLAWGVGLSPFQRFQDTENECVKGAHEHL